MNKLNLLYYLQSTTDFQMSRDQQRALKVFHRFMESTFDKKLLVVSGYAGSGKTSLTGHMNSAIKKCGYGSRLLAPTGRAAKVLAKYCDQKAQTIHKEIYFGGNEFMENYALTVAKNDGKDTVFFVDEASMINSGNRAEEDVLRDLLSYVYGGANCSVVLIGDTGQLPPVGQDFSPALNTDELKLSFPEIEIFSAHLSEIYRIGETSSILRNATYIRNKDHFAPPFIPVLDEKTISLKGNEVQEYLEDSIQEVGWDDVMVLTLSNKQAIGWNMGIRSRILFKEERVEAGESLLVVKNNYYWMENESALGFLANGEIIKVEKVIQEVSLYGFDFMKAFVSFPSSPEEAPKEVILLLDTLLMETHSLGREKMKELFFEIEKDYMHIKGKKNRQSQVLKDPYFNAVHVKYAYAVTVHKAQGGQWSHVYIDGSFVPEQMKDSSYLRWLYTAVTRSMKKLFLVNFPDHFIKTGSTD